jgi:hypothetical protein
VAEDEAIATTKLTDPHVKSLVTAVIDLERLEPALTDHFSDEVYVRATSLDRQYPSYS